MAAYCAGFGSDEGGGDGLHRQRSGESRQADIGVSLPGSGESPVAPVYIRGEKAGVLKGADIAKQFQDIIEKFVRENYAKQGS